MHIYVLIAVVVVSTGRIQQKHASSYIIQRLPYRSLYIFTSHSTSVDGISPHSISSWRLHLFHHAYLRTGCCRGGVHTSYTTNTRSLVHHTTSLFQKIKKLFSGSGTQSRQNNEIITLHFKSYYFVLKLELINYFPSMGRRKIHTPQQGLAKRSHLG